MTRKAEPVKTLNIRVRVLSQPEILVKGGGFYSVSDSRVGVIVEVLDAPALLPRIRPMIITIDVNLGIPSLEQMKIVGSEVDAVWEYERDQWWNMIWYSWPSGENSDQ